MSTNSWLSRQRKSDLTELAQHTGLKNYEGFKKPELESALDEFLTENSAHFSLDPKVAPYYTSRSKASGSPVKREVGSPIKRDVDGTLEKLKVARRRATKVAEEIANQENSDDDDDDESSNANSSALVQTPGRALSLASRIPLPATPADVANAVDRSTVAVRTRVASLYKESGITEATNTARESLSTVNSVLLAINAFELYFLRPEVLADRYAFTIPAVAFLGTGDYPVFVPDMFLLLSASFWSPALLWAFTSVVLPSLVGYFINLTSNSNNNNAAPQGRVVRRAAAAAAPTSEYVVDPLTYSIVKAIISFVVYGQGVTFGGWVNPQSIERVNGAVYGGYKGVLVGAAITGVFSVYDAILKK